MNTEQNYTKTEDRLDAMEKLLHSIDRKLEKVIAANACVGDRLKEEDIMMITGLGKTSLYNLRKNDKVRSSTIAERGVFYRLSDFEKILRKNEK